MNEVHLGGIDMNLLVALDALLETKSVTRAAGKVGLTQSAMSHALKRLRGLTGDELLVRGKEAMVPTARAEQLGPPIRVALAGIAQALAPEAPFDPAKAKRTIVVGTSDYAELVLLPPLVARLAQEAPHVDLRARVLTGEMSAAVTAGEIDLAIAPVGREDERPGVHARRLFDERFVCVMRARHPLARARTISLARFAAASHALIAPRGTEGGFVDDALARHGLSRRVAVAVPHFLVAPHVVASSDLVLTLAARIARVVAGPLGLAVRPLPRELVLPGFTMSALWHERTHADPALRWARELLAEVAKKA